MTNEQVKSSKKITVGLIVSWIFGILFALTGFISVFSEPIPGIVMLIMGAVLLPPVNKFVDEKWKFHLSGGMKAVVLIIGFIIFGSTVDTSKQQSNQVPSQQEQSVSTTEQKKDEIKPTEDKKTLILDLPNISNKTEKEVEAILGKADRTEKVKGYPCEETNCQRAFYNTDKIEIIFKEGKANRITVNGTSDFTSNDNALENLGLKIEKPTFKNPTNVIRWENVQNFAEISFFTDYILIQVSNPTPNEKPEPIKEVTVPAEYKSALNKAMTYAKTMHMSKQGVYDQLVSEYGEKFSADAAQYAIDNMTADWNANSLAKAKTYQNTMNMSPSAIHDQLTSAYGEKFTKAEADYAIQHLND